MAKPLAAGQQQRSRGLLSPPPGLALQGWPPTSPSGVRGKLVDRLVWWVGVAISPCHIDVAQGPMDPKGAWLEGSMDGGMDGCTDGWWWGWKMEKLKNMTKNEKSTPSLAEETRKRRETSGQPAGGPPTRTARAAGPGNKNRKSSGWPGAWAAGRKPCREGAWAAGDHRLADLLGPCPLRASPA